MSLRCAGLGHRPARTAARRPAAGRAPRARRHRSRDRAAPARCTPPRAGEHLDQLERLGLRAGQLAAQDPGVDRHRQRRAARAGPPTGSSASRGRHPSSSARAQVRIAPQKRRAGPRPTAKRPPVRGSVRADGGDEDVVGRHVHEPPQQAALAEVDHGRAQRTRSPDRAARPARARRARSRRSARPPSVCAGTRPASCAASSAASPLRARIGRQRVARCADRQDSGVVAERAGGRHGRVGPAGRGHPLEPALEHHGVAGEQDDVVVAFLPGLCLAARPRPRDPSRSCSRPRDPSSSRNRSTPGSAGPSPTRVTSTSRAVCSTTARMHRWRRSGPAVRGM